MIFAMHEHAALERIEIDAMTDVFRAAPAALREAHAITVRSVAGAHCLTTRDFSPPAMFRRTAGLGVTRPASRADVDEIIEYMDRIGQQYCISTSPHTQPPEMTDWLLARGFVHGYAWMKFSRPCSPPLAAPSDLNVQIVDRRDADIFGVVVAEGFGFPPIFGSWFAALPGREGWTCLLAFDGRQAVAAGSAYVRDGYAWLGFAATLSSHRRRGAQMALLARRLQEAAARGAHTAVIETGERLPDKPSNSYRNILRAGFVERYLRQNLLSPVPGL